MDIITNVPEHAPRIEQLIRELGLEPHPEGGRYVEIHRSAAITAIYFLLLEGEQSRLHQVRSEEIWHFYEGAPLDLVQLPPDGSELERVVLAPAGGLHRQVHCVPGGYWQAARSRGPYTLVGCTVAPAFRFEDFSLLRDSPRAAAAITARHPAIAEFV